MIRQRVEASACRANTANEACNGIPSLLTCDQVVSLEAKMIARMRLIRSLSCSQAEGLAGRPD